MGRAAFERRTAVITGMGLVSPFGVGLDPFWRAVLDGRSAVSPVRHFGASGLPCRFAAYLEDGSGESFPPPGACVGEPRFACFSAAAARMASEMSRWAGCVAPERAGVFLGTSGERASLERLAEMAYEARVGDGTLSAADCARAWASGLTGVIKKSLPHHATARVARELNAAGPIMTVNTACTSSAHAIGQALRAVQHGSVDLAITGGAECLVSQMGFHIFSPLGVLSRRNEAPEKASRPFDAERDGFVLGEGAGILVMEEKSLALSRGAGILAEVAGYGTSCDAYRITDEAPDGRGAVLAMRRALDDASVKPEEIDYINAHGTSTLMNDRIETAAVKSVFGRRAYEIPMSSIKSMIGHTISAAGAIELIACVLALRDQVVPPTINYEYPDPECDLDYVPNRARVLKLEAVLSNSFGFGGHNDCLVVRRFTA